MSEYRGTLIGGVVAGTVAAPASPMGQELPPPDAYEPNGREPTAYKATTVRNLAERIRHLERELAERKPASIDTPVFRALLSRVQGWKDGNALIDGAARALIAYIDGRTAGSQA